MVRSGLRVLDAMLEEDRTALCGPRDAHQPARAASRAGTVPSEVVLGGCKVAVSRPRVRADGREVPQPTFQALAHTDPLHRRVVEHMLVGVATRQYARSLEPRPAGVVRRGTSRSSVRRRVVAKTTVQLRTWQSAPLDDLDLVAVLLDGVHIGEHGLVVAFGIAADGQKHALGLWEGATENAAVCQSLLAHLPSRGLRTDRRLLVILDGALALHKAGRAVVGEAALIQRCPVHTLRNILDPLPERQRPWGQAIVRCAYQASDVQTATRLLTALAQRLGDEYPSAAGRVREGLDEPLTVLTLHLSTRLQRSLATTTAAERLLSRTRHVKRHVNTVAWWTDDAAVGGHRCPRSRQGLPAPEGMRRYAAVGQRASRTRPTTGTRCLRGERRVASHPSRRRVLTAVGTSPLENAPAPVLLGDLGVEAGDGTIVACAVLEFI